MRSACSAYRLCSTANVAALRKSAQFLRVEDLDVGDIFDTSYPLIFSYLSLEESRFNMPYQPEGPNKRDSHTTKYVLRTHHHSNLELLYQ
jgi:hypothetical protein